MSAPDTNLDKQKRRHAGPIIGITAGIIFVAIILGAYLLFIAGPVEDDEGGVTGVPEASEVAPAADEVEAVPATE